MAGLLSMLGKRKERTIMQARSRFTPEPWRRRLLAAGAALLLAACSTQRPGLNQPIGADSPAPSAF
ncbi:MAG: lipoprotein, partial [Burkholderiaceae bacterium]|nr:lipoprotein [Burkholderiaceae bacterium]